MLLGIVKAVLGRLTGNLATALTRAYQIKVNSRTERDRIRADVVIRDIEAKIEARRQATEIRMATAGFWEMRLITFLIAGGYTFHFLLVTADTCFSLEWGIPKFPEPFASAQMSVMLSFFGVQVASRAIDAAAFIFGGRK